MRFSNLVVSAALLAAAVRPPPPSSAFSPPPPASAFSSTTAARPGTTCGGGGAAVVAPSPSVADGSGEFFRLSAVAEAASASPAAADVGTSPAAASSSSSSSSSSLASPGRRRGRRRRRGGTGKQSSSSSSSSSSPSQPQPRPSSSAVADAAPGAGATSKKSTAATTTPPPRNKKVPRHRFPGKPRGAYADSSVSDLKATTDAFLAEHRGKSVRSAAGGAASGRTTTTTTTTKMMTSSQLHEAGRLLHAWAKRVRGPASTEEGEDATPPLVSNGDSARDDDDDEEEEGRRMAGPLSESLLRLIVDDQLNGLGNPAARPTADMYDAVINAHAKSGTRHGPRRATAVLDRMEELYQFYCEDADDAQCGHPAPEPRCYASAMDGWARKRPVDRRSAEEAERLLDRLGRAVVLFGGPLEDYSSSVASSSSSSSLSSSPSSSEGGLTRQRETKHFNAVMNAWAELGRGDRAEGLLWRMVVLSESGAERAVRPDLRSYNAALKAWGRSDARGAARNAERILRLMENNGNGNGGKSGGKKSKGGNRKGDKAGAAAGGAGTIASSVRAPRPDAVSYTCCIDAWAKSGEKDAAPRAEELLGRMSRPDVWACNAVANAWAASGRSDAGERAEALLERMIARSAHGGGGGGAKKKTGRKGGWPEPDLVTYNSVIKAHANAGHGNDGPARAEAVLDRMLEEGVVTPDAISFNTVLSAYAKSGGGAEAARRAESLLDRMERGSSDPDARLLPPPDRVSYNTVMAAWANCGDAQAAPGAEAVFRRMTEPTREEGGVADGEQESKMTTTAATPIVVEPDVATYNTLLTAWSRSPQRDAPKRAERILDRMIRLHRTSTVRAIDNYAALPGGGGGGVGGGGNRAQQQQQKPSCRPDARSFAAAAAAWGRSRDPRKAKRAQDVLRRMEKLRRFGGGGGGGGGMTEAGGGSGGGGGRNGDDDPLRPNEYVYGAVLNACAHTHPRASKKIKDEALTVAFETFSEMKREASSGSTGLRMNHVVYGTFLRACSVLMDDADGRRRPLAENVFRKAMGEGQVGVTVLEQFRRAAPPDLVVEMLGGLAGAGAADEVALDDLPEEWTRNVRERGRGAHGGRGGRWHGKVPRKS